MPCKTREEQRRFQNNWKHARRREAIAQRGGCCVECGSTEELEFDHVDRTTKVEHKVWSWSKERREAELAKCQLLCRSCHIEKTREENTVLLVHGTRSGYRKGCRCADCCLGNATYEHQRRASGHQSFLACVTKVEPAAMQQNP